MRKLLLLLSFAFAVLISVSCSNSDKQSTNNGPQLEYADAYQQTDVVPVQTAVSYQESAATVSTDITAPVYLTQDTEDPPVESDQSVWDFILSNLGILLFALMASAKIIVNLTPTEKDNKIFAWIDSIFNAIIPNYKKGGGTFTS